MKGYKTEQVVMSTMLLLILVSFAMAAKDTTDSPQSLSPSSLRSLTDLVITGAYLAAFATLIPTIALLLLEMAVLSFSWIRRQKSESSSKEVPKNDQSVPNLRVKKEYPADVGSRSSRPPSVVLDSAPTIMKRTSSLQGTQK